MVEEQEQQQTADGGGGGSGTGRSSDWAAGWAPLRLQAATTRFLLPCTAGGSVGFPRLWRRQEEEEEEEVGRAREQRRLRGSAVCTAAACHRYTHCYRCLCAAADFALLLCCP